VSLSGAAVRPVGSLRRADAIAAFFAGTTMIALAYYVLLLRETTFHRAAAADASRPFYGVIVAALAVAACILFGVNVAVLYLLARVRSGRRLSIGAVTGGLAGAFGAGCPSCGAFLLSTVGVGGGLAALPLGGIELWVGAVLLMAVTSWSALRRLGRCSDSECPALPPPSTIQTAGLTFLGLAAAVTLAALIAVNE
jgi:hypothetical protein